MFSCCAQSITLCIQVNPTEERIFLFHCFGFCFVVVCGGFIDLTGRIVIVSFLCLISTFMCVSFSFMNGVRISAFRKMDVPSSFSLCRFILMVFSMWSSQTLLMCAWYS